MSQSFKDGDPMGPKEVIEQKDLTPHIMGELAKGADKVEITPCEDSLKSDPVIRLAITNEELADRIDKLAQTINHIFGGHVLINGKWTKVV